MKRKFVFRVPFQVEVVTTRDGDTQLGLEKIILQKLDEKTYFSFGESNHEEGIYLEGRIVKTEFIPTEVVVYQEEEE